MPQLIGTAPSQIPTNGHLGSAAFMDANAFYGTGLNPVFRNRIINGDMRVDQRNSGTSVTSSVLQTQVFTVDRWAYYNDVVSKRTIQQSSVAPTGFKTSLKVTVIATDTSGPQQFLRQSIEGYNIVDLNWGTANAQPAVLSFWVRSSISGQHGGAIQSLNSDQSFPFAYTINTVDTWEYKTISIPGPTTGTWGSSTGIGLSLQFEHGVGYQKTQANVWVGSNTTTSSGSVNLCATNGATWYITGIQFEKGTVATPFENRPFGLEVALCQRYFQTSYAGAKAGTAYANNCYKGENPFTWNVATGAWSDPDRIRLPVEMRSAPSVTFYGINTGTVNTAGGTYCASTTDGLSIHGATSTTRYVGIYAGGGGYTAPGEGNWSCNWTASAEL